MQVLQPYEQTVQAILNLGEIANFRSGEQVPVCLKDDGEDPFQRTLKLLSLERRKTVRARRKQIHGAAAKCDEFVPKDEQLHLVFVRGGGWRIRKIALFGLCLPTQPELN